MFIVKGSSFPQLITAPTTHPRTAALEQDHKLDGRADHVCHYRQRRQEQEPHLTTQQGIEGSARGLV